MNVLPIELIAVISSAILRKDVINWVKQINKQYQHSSYE